MKSVFPELVDLKITNYCPYGCQFCYQASTTRGKHAEYDNLVKIVDLLHDMSVFEIAIGGGEPTLYPQFEDFIRYVDSKNITPNFTTKNIDYLKESSILDLVGGMAYSITSTQEINDVLNSLPKGWKYNHKLVFHVVLGTITQEEFRSILRMASENYIKLTLLGYKYVGFGKKFVPVPYDDWWLKEIQDIRNTNQWMSIGIDTPLAAGYSTKLKKYGVSDVFYTTREGEQSCYIDGVKMKLAESSYCSKYHELPLTKDEFKVAFANI